MDFLDPKKKKAHRIRLFIGYGLMTVMLGFSTALVVLLTNGYNLNRDTGEIFQNGLIIADSHPVEANIFINGDLAGRTAKRLVLPEGDYLLELKRDGYRSWQRDVELSGSVIEQFVYPFLFPETLVSKNIASYPKTTTFVTQSPNRRWLLVESPTATGSFDLIDLSDPENAKRNLSMPTDTLTPFKGKHKFELAEWSSDNNNVLIKHSWDSGSEYIILNIAKPIESINISKLFSQYNSFEVTLRDKKANQFYFYNPKTLSLLRANLNTKTAEVVLAGVLEFKPFKADTIIYINDKQEVRILDKNLDFQVRVVAKHTDYILDYAEFKGKAYLVFGSAADDKTYVYIDPINAYKQNPQELPSPFRVLTVSNPQFASFSTNARFIAVQGGSEFAVLDFETVRQYRYDTKLKTALNEKAHWMDGHRLVLVSNQKTIIFDYDGFNLQQLGDSNVQTQTYFDSSYEAMFNIFTTGDKINLIRHELLVE